MLFFNLWLATAASAQDLCVAATDMQRMFTNLKSTAQLGTPITPAQLTELTRIDNRYTTFSVRLAFRHSPVADLKPVIINGYTLSHSILEGLVANGATPLLD